MVYQLNLKRTDQTLADKIQLSYAFHISYIDY